MRFVCGSLLWLLVSATARSQDDSFYISIPSARAVYKLDRTSQSLTLFATGLSMPFYGEWYEGTFYLPDRLLGAVMTVDSDGNVSVLSSGGLLTSPVTAVIDTDGRLFVSDYWGVRIVEIDRQTGAQQVFADQSSGLLDGPGGLALSPDGWMYVANYLDKTVVRFDADGNGEFFWDGSAMLEQPGGMRIDGSGNLFIANYLSTSIVRVRLRDRRAEVFASGPDLGAPNDLKFVHEGGLVTTTEDNSALVHVNALGQTTILASDSSLGSWFGVASPADFPPCTGSMTPYGTGTPGSGGFVPQIGGIFTPCPGAEVGIEIEGALGNAAGFLLFGIQSANTPAFGGTLLVSFAPPSGLIPLVHPGVGLGGGELVAPFRLPDDAGLVGVSLYLQDLVIDPGAPQGVAMSAGLELYIGQ